MARDKNNDNILDMMVRLLEKEAEKKEFVEGQKKLPKLNLEDFELKQHPDYDHIELLDPKTGKTAGNFQWVKEHIIDPTNIQEGTSGAFRRIPLDDYIKMDYPELEPEYRGRGLGGQMYKKIEEITGKKIIPDTDLSTSSLALQEKKGLGKSFGQSEYKPGIIKNILKSIGDSPANRELAEQLYKDRKQDMINAGLKGFKSLAPILGKGLAAGAGGAMSLVAEASDSPEAGDPLSQEALERDIQAHKTQKGIEESQGVPDEVKLKALELFKKNRLPY